MKPRPPISTHFPYTTLFRSWNSATVTPRLQRGGVLMPEEVFVTVVSSRPLLVQAVAEEDRKSTRLNSSHSSISYAVFCLKKKITFCSWSIFSCCHWK